MAVELSNGHWTRAADWLAAFVGEGLTAASPAEVDRGPRFGVNLDDLVAPGDIAADADLIGVEIGPARLVDDTVTRALRRALRRVEIAQRLHDGRDIGD